MKKEHLLKLENHLCFAIYACSREITRMYRPYLEELGITYPQYLALLVLWEQERLTVKELGEALYLDSGTLTPMLKRMELLELVKRERSKADERKVYIALTEKGAGLKEGAHCIPEALLLKSGASQQELFDMLQRCNALLQSIHQQNEGE